ncbi:MAG: molybdate ABC transporter substrate-binding protein [Pseudoclavibacter sp.]
MAISSGVDATGANSTGRRQRRASRTRRRAAATIIASLAALALSACGTSAAADPGNAAGASDTSGSSASSGSTAASLDGSITVFAAASLADTFTELADEFEAQHPGIDVELSFAGSSDLVVQISSGAPADVFASADEANMAKLTDAGLIEQDAPIAFATNHLTIAVSPGNPAGVTSLADLADPALNVVVCAPQVPCGAATKRVEEAAGVTLSPVSEESAVTDVLGKVTSGEADAGLVYVTDAIGADDAVEQIDIPESSAAVNVYPIAPVAETAHPEASAAFIDFATSDAGLELLAAAGFGSP